MRYSDDRFHLQVAFDTKQCEIPRDELVRMQNALDQQYQEALGYSALSRTTTGGVRITW